MPLHAEEWLIKEACEILDLKRAEILSVFCGMCEYGVRVDIKPEVNPHYIGDVHKLSEFLPEKLYDIILADPPYSTEESKEIYGTGKLSYRTWTKECDKYLRDGGLFIIYHKFLVPNPDPTKYEVVKRVAIFNRVWHLPRVAVYFRKGYKP